MPADEIGPRLSASTAGLLSCLVVRSGGHQHRVKSRTGSRAWRLRCRCSGPRCFSVQLPNSPGSRVVESRLPWGWCCFWEYRKKLHARNAPETQPSKVRCVRMMASSSADEAQAGRPLLIFNKHSPGRRILPRSARQRLPMCPLHVVLSHQRREWELASSPCRRNVCRVPGVSTNRSWRGKAWQGEATACSLRGMAMHRTRMTAGHTTEKTQRNVVVVERVKPPPFRPTCKKHFDDLSHDGP